MKESAISIEQAIYGGQDACGYRFLARSPGFRDEWLPEAQRLCAGFGERPAGVACPACIFAQPFGKRHVAVVQVADQGSDDAGRPGALAFRLLVLSRPDYLTLSGDPFLVADRFPPPWQARGELAALTWPVELPALRTAEQVQRVLQRVDDGPNLLGGSQVLVDGGRLVFERPGPDTELLRSLWMLLPTSTRCQLWPASFAFGNALRFDALVAPYADGEEYAGYLRGEQAGDYPEGRYELNLQIAAEAGDQRELNAVFARRSRAQTWRLALILLGMCIVLAVFGNLLVPSPVARVAAPTSVKLDLPSADHYPTLSAPERRRLTQALEALAKEVGMQPLPEPATAETLLAAIADRLGTPNAAPDPGAHLTSGPVQRRLRALLWKHGVTEYRDPNLNAVELVERLQQKVVSKKSAAKDRRD